MEELEQMGRELYSSKYFDAKEVRQRLEQASKAYNDVIINLLH